MVPISLSAGNIVPSNTLAEYKNVPMMDCVCFVSVGDNFLEASCVQVCCVASYLP